jgi:hypothetical protein
MRYITRKLAGFLVRGPNSGLWLVEAKAGKTIQPGMAAPLLSLQRSLGKKASRLIIVHRRPHSSLTTSAVREGVEALAVEHFIQELLQDLKRARPKPTRH